MTDTLKVLQLGQAIEVTRCLGQAPSVQLHALAVGRFWSIDLFSRYVSSYRHLPSLHVYDEETDDRAIDTIYRSVKRTGAKVILPASAHSIRFVSAHQGVLSQFVAVPPSPTLDAFDMVSDKWLLTKFVAEHQLCHPPTVLCTMGKTFERDLRELSFPVLLKPRQDLRDGVGIKRFDTAEQLLFFLGEEPGHSGRYIVQNLIQGYDVSCSVLCQEGKILAYTIHKNYIPSQRPYSSLAAVIEFVEDEQVLDVVTRLMSALGWSGVVNIDLRYEEKSRRVRVLEFNPRYWGSLMGSLSAGVNFPYLQCLAGIGVPFNKPAYSKKRFVAKEISSLYSALRRRGGHQKGFAFNDTTLRYDLVDPLPWVAGRLASLGRRAVGIAGRLSLSG
jgi:predicted ATP-grasp superfamily ATP-dependent carboligase